MDLAHLTALLREMDAQGGSPDALWELADAMPGNGDVPAGKAMTVAEAYPSSLGCDTP
ncbi:MAG: hypothetical protein IT200_03465 [Thermoleophilia bacterium]|nr:hypothetical protein [Thermoleophilia bacterium]